MRVFASNLSLLMENRGLTQQTSRLRRLAEKDELMGIHNRRSLMQLFEKEVERSRRFRQPLSVVMIDIDHFKTWNDVYGHQAGDAVLRDVAQLVLRCSREIDVVGRYGGDEVLVVLPETCEDGAILFAERLRATVEQLGRERLKSYPEAALTISMGVAELQPDRDDLHSLIQRVDRGLYSAKNRGRNQVQLG
jgi:diguanylate cyclase (GGDEF)-like protein